MSNTSFNPSTFDKQAAASLDMIDEQAAAERVQKILHPEMAETINAAKEAVAYANSPMGKRIASESRRAGPTLTPQPQTQPQAPAPKLEASKSKLDPQGSFPLNKPRKTRSDAGIPKKAPADPDEIVLRLTLAEARGIALAKGMDLDLSAKIQDQIIAQLQKRLDALQKGK